ncbi:ribbon-helix-helix protein, CopG family [Deltaproteobacteria bacterium TL4]
MHNLVYLIPFDKLIPMANRRLQSYTTPAERTVRASVSFPEDQYAELERIALEQRVSLAWVVREAVRTYIVTRNPLLENEDTNTNIYGTSKK